MDFTENVRAPLPRGSTESCSSSSESRADAIGASRSGRWHKGERADDQIPSKMFILFGKAEEKTNAYGGGGWRRGKVCLCDRKWQKTQKSLDTSRRLHVGQSKSSGPVWKLEVANCLRHLPFSLLLCPAIPLARLPVLPHLPPTFTLPSAPLPARLICVACLICIHMSQREKGFVGRRNRRGKRRYAGRWRLMKRNEKHSFRLCPPLPPPVSPSMALTPFTLPSLRFGPHTL